MTRKLYYEDPYMTEFTAQVLEAADGSINWPRRFDLMQQHSGEHILSGILHEMTGCDNVGFHLSTDNIYVDFDKPIEWETLL